MRTIEDLLWLSGRSDGCPAPAANPLTDRNALQEAQLLDVRFDALRSTIALIFELRVSLQFDEGNTGVLIARAVRDIDWKVSKSPSTRTAWNVVSSSVTQRGDAFEFRLGTWPDALMSLTASNLEFYVGEVPELDRIPNYVNDSEEELTQQLAGWRSELRVSHRSAVGSLHDES
ncbi:MAG: hypothetical protein JWQ39_2933 [Glaciihabitans sp.]|nr:hypothetical protein [Glaciihabitans sp.]